MKTHAFLNKLTDQLLPMKREENERRRDSIELLPRLYYYSFMITFTPLLTRSLSLSFSPALSLFLSRSLFHSLSQILNRKRMALEVKNAYRFSHTEKKRNTPKRKKKTS